MNSKKPVGWEKEPKRHRDAYYAGAKQKMTKTQKTAFRGELNKVNEIGTFWVVTKPTPDSTLVDIVFESTIMGMMRQTLGGLREKDIVGIYKHETTARQIGERLLK
jgi:hypothetical protein